MVDINFYQINQIQMVELKDMYIKKSIKAERHDDITEETINIFVLYNYIYKTDF